ncbi:hypothetical protein C8034_v005236 [Colletotrichum sidae]|uniref:Uncharacterized protein n=1 Tax=Colletotrichum sidae TaxID=1347389 RepID=A0A4R8T8Q5_9PEZI|nr:hypothetical protein C8034_v005236 [Colletotrichum sidae]
MRQIPEVRLTPLHPAVGGRAASLRAAQLGAVVVCLVRAIEAEAETLSLIFATAVGVGGDKSSQAKSGEEKLSDVHDCRCNK